MITATFKSFASKTSLKKILLIITLTSLYTALKADDQILIISVPKCGTHILFKTLKLLSGIQKNISPQGFCILDEQQMGKNSNEIVLTHAIHVEKNIELLKYKTNIKKFFIYRDPRDQIISNAYYIQRYQKIWPIWTKYKSYTFDELILDLIQSGESWRDWQEFHGTLIMCPEAWTNLEGIDQLYKLYLPWHDHHNVYVTTFEKLIGSEGGGDQETQMNEIKNIGWHLGWEISTKTAQNISKSLFGRTTTFRQGNIGSWKSHFTQEHKEAFKNVAGQLLIELGYEKDFDWQ